MQKAPETALAGPGLPHSTGGGGGGRPVAGGTDTRDAGEHTQQGPQPPASGPLAPPTVGGSATRLIPAAACMRLRAMRAPQPRNRPTSRTGMVRNTDLCYTCMCPRTPAQLSWRPCRPVPGPQIPALAAEPVRPTPMQLDDGGPVAAGAAACRSDTVATASQQTPPPPEPLPPPAAGTTGKPQRLEPPLPGAGASGGGQPVARALARLPMAPAGSTGGGSGSEAPLMAAATAAGAVGAAPLPGRAAGSGRRKASRGSGGPPGGGLGVKAGGSRKHRGGAGGAGAAPLNHPAPQKSSLKCARSGTARGTRAGARGCIKARRMRGSAIGLPPPSLAGSQRPSASRLSGSCP
jgi:hypothetical protein